ncbi:hypothetical protein AZSI13_31350 [Azospira sp. I13]|uniref:helix-turn-helix domain-containing protein n=1 Tax=Azospira sp. I13 TaxID=1765050 RepID=UPI000D4C1B83|nr:helix-turn-helix domain-containing protein [Azospira sp. I13]GBG03808.1 hypothetical protein AZSI13_31350 [Azospira sp. I13]
MTPNNKKAAPAGTGTASNAAFTGNDRTTPTVTGQAAQVLGLIRKYQPILSLHLTADHAIPQAAARIHGMRAMGFNILTTIRPSVVFRGRIRRNIAAYSLGVPEWPRPGFSTGAHESEQFGLDSIQGGAK